MSPTRSGGGDDDRAPIGAAEPAPLAWAEIDALVRLAERDRAARRERERRRTARLARMPGARRAGPVTLGGSVIRWPDSARILAIRPDHLGDVLLAGPALARLRAGRPSDEILLLVGPWSEAVAGRLEGPDRVETFAFPAFARLPRRRLPGRGLLGVLRLARHIARGRWDVVFVLRDDDSPSAWAAALAGVPIRIGHASPSVAPFLTHGLADRDRPAHVTAAGLALVRGALEGTESRDGGLAHNPLKSRSSRAEAGEAFEHDPLTLRTSPAEAGEAETCLAQLRSLGPTDPRGPVAIHPGAGAAVKLWTSAGWAAVARALCASGEPLLLTGGEAERSLTAELARRLASVEHGAHPVLDLAGRTDVGTLAALYERCRIVLGPDSGPLHLAAAVGTPSVSLFGPADPARFGPWGPSERHRVVMNGLPCAPCGRLDWPEPESHPCVRALTVAAVVDAALRSMGRASETGAGREDA